MSKEVMIVTGAGQISMAIARRMGYGKKIILGDKKENNAQAIAEIMNRAGFDVDESLHSLPARLEILSVAGAPADSSDVMDSAASTASAPAVVSEVKVTIREGKFHQIKRMFSARGMEVLYLKRLSMGPLTLDPDLPEGSFRPLTQEELEALRES